MKTLTVIVTALLAVLAFSGGNPAGNTNAYTLPRDTVYNQTTTDSCLYWITKTTGRRHNNTCSKYRKTKGYCTDDKIGIPCSWCGG